MRFVLAVIGVLGLSHAVTGQASRDSADLLRLAEASLEFQNLPDVQAFSVVAGGMREATLTELANPDLQKQRRVAFYALGAGLALLLDQDSDTWKGKYLTEKFFVERYAGVG